MWRGVLGVDVGAWGVLFLPTPIICFHRESKALYSTLILKAKKELFRHGPGPSDDSGRRHWGLPCGSRRGSPPGRLPGS